MDTAAMSHSPHSETQTMTNGITSLLSIAIRLLVGEREKVQVCVK